MVLKELKVSAPFAFKNRNKRSKYKRRIVKEDHYVVIAQPSDLYLNHFTPKSSKAADIAIELWKLVSEFKNSLKIIGADGTNTNVGNKSLILSLLILSSKLTFLTL